MLYMILMLFSPAEFDSPLFNIPFRKKSTYSLMFIPYFNERYMYNV